MQSTVCAARADTFCPAVGIAVAQRGQQRNDVTNKDRCFASSCGDQIPKRYPGYPPVHPDTARLALQHQGQLAQDAVDCAHVDTAGVPFFPPKNTALAQPFRALNVWVAHQQDVSCGDAKQLAARQISAPKRTPREQERPSNAVQCTPEASVLQRAEGVLLTGVFDHSTSQASTGLGNCVSPDSQTRHLNQRARCQSELHQKSDTHSQSAHSKGPTEPRQSCGHVQLIHPQSCWHACL